MNYKTLYETLFKRKSIRKYDMTPLDQNTISEITRYIKSINPIVPDIKTQIKIFDKNDINSAMTVKAPNYIAFFSEPKDGYLLNAGFMLESLDIFLSAKGLGTCYQGMASPKKEIINGSNLQFVIILAFGKPSEPIYRNNVLEFKRKDIESITDSKALYNILEPVRLAPSSMNSQPWFFSGNEDKITAYCTKKMFLKRLNKIDMGIAICFLDITTKNVGKRISVSFNKDAKDITSGSYYTADISIK